MAWRPVVLALLAMPGLALPGVALAHDTGQPHHGVVSHGDPRVELPDSLITQSVAQAELGSLEPASPASGGQAPETWCGDALPTTNDTANAVVAATRPHLKMIYAYPKGPAGSEDMHNRFATVSHRLQANVSLLQRYMASQSGGRKALRWDMGTSCGAQYVDIQVVRLPQEKAFYVPNGAPSFSMIRDAVTADPAVGTLTGTRPRNLVIYADGMQGTNGVGGTASQRIIDEAATTDHDYGALAAAVFGPATLPSGSYAWPTVMLHEIAHNLGAVQDSSPQSSGAGHCFDERDLMCYADGGPTPLTYPCNPLAADMNETFDCGSDDYFHPNPAQGSYLDEFWNVYSSAHLGDCAVELASQCGLADAAGDGARPTNTTPVPSNIYRRSWTTTLSGTDGEAAIDGFQWRVDGGPIQRTATATVTGATDGQYVVQTRVRDANGNWSQGRRDLVHIDVTPPAPYLTCPTTWSTTTAPTCSWAISTTGSRTATVETQRGSEPVTSIPNGSTGTFEATAEMQAMKVRATDEAGNVSAWVQATARWDTANPAVDVSCAAAWGRDSTTCNVSASDSGSGLSTVRWRAGGGPLTTVPANADFTVSVEGAQTITVVATDVAGLTSQDTATSRVDRTPPEAGITCADGVHDGPVDCTFTGSDTLSGLASLRYSVAGGPPQDVVSGTTIPIAAAGVNEVIVTAVDKVGHTRTAKDTTSIDVDQEQQPAVVVLQPPPAPAVVQPPAPPVVQPPIPPVPPTPAPKLQRLALRGAVPMAFTLKPRPGGVTLTLAAPVKLKTGKHALKLCVKRKCTTRRFRARGRTTRLPALKVAARKGAVITATLTGASGKSSGRVTVR